MILKLCILVIFLLLLVVVTTCWSAACEHSGSCVVCSNQDKDYENFSLPLPLYQNINCLNVCIGICASHNFTCVLNQFSNLSISPTAAPTGVNLSGNHTVTVESDCIGSSYINSSTTAIICLVIAGIALVGLATALDLRISSGRLNGLIFYAASIHLNQDLFFQTKGVLSLFFSWLNLDLGFSVCFYNELNSTNKLWLQLAFPLYIVFLVLIIFLAFQYSTILYNLSVAVLPINGSLLVLAYLKLLRTTISILSFKTVNGTWRVWIFEENLSYKLEHITLLLYIVSVLFLILVVPTCTLLLIASQYSYHIATDVLVESKFGLTLSLILDMYTGRFKKHTRFWFGLILLFYTFQVIIYYFTGSNGVTNLVVTIISSCLLLYISLLMDGVYTKRYLVCNKLEHFLFLNLIAVSALTILRHSGNHTFSCYYIYALIFPAFLILFIPILEHSGKFQHFWGHSDSRQVSDRPFLPDSDSESNYTRDSLTTEEKESSSECTMQNRESLLSSTALPLSTFSTLDDVQESNSLKTIVTSSELFINKNCDKYNGEADLVPVDISVERTVGKDSDGVNTLTIQYSHSSHRTPLLLTPNCSDSSKQNLPTNPEVVASCGNSTKGSSDTSEVRSLSKASSVLSLLQYKNNQYGCSIKRRHSLGNSPKIKQVKRNSFRTSERKCSQTSKKGSTTVLSKLLPSLKVSTSVIEITSAGKSLSHRGIVVDIPPGAVDKGVRIRLETGLLAHHGPFQFPKDYACVSPILWLYCDSPNFVRFKKRVRIVLPHCLKKVTTIGNESLGLCFMKAVESIGSIVNFKPIDFSDHVFSFAGNRGTFETMNSNAFFCVTAKHSSSLIVKKAEFCLTRIEPKQWTTNATVFFCVSYLLKSCLEDIEKQFPPEKFNIVSKQHFQFQESSNPSISIAVSCSTSDWSLIVENNVTITAKEVHLSNDLHQLTKECGLYPPHFQLRVCKSSISKSPPSTAFVSFRGIKQQVDYKLLLQSTVNYSLSDPSFSKRSKDAGRYCSLGLTPNSSFHHLVKEIEDLRELEHEPFWEDLELRVVHKVATKWKEIGTLLIDEYTLAEIDEDFKSCKNKMRKVLKTWSEGGECLPYYWSSLVVVLRTEIVGETNLAGHLLEDYCIRHAYM